MQTGSSKRPSESALVSMEVDATGAGGATTGTTAADDPRLTIDAFALAASSAPSESSRLAACSGLAARWVPSDPLAVLDRITSSAHSRWWEDRNERSEDVRLERCRVVSAALLLLQGKGAENGSRKEARSAAPPLPPAPGPPLPSLPPPPDLSQRAARCLALSLRDDFHEVALAACEGARLLAGLLVAEASSLSARERALALDSVASSAPFPSRPSRPLPLPADLLVGVLARVAASHRRSAVREAGADALGALCPVASRSGGALGGQGGGALAALAALAAADPFPRVRAAAVAAAGAALGSTRASTWLARRALPVLALALTDADGGVSATAAAALALALPASAAAAGRGGGGGEGGGGGGEGGDRLPPLRTTVSMEDASAATAAAAVLRTTVSMTEAEAEGDAAAVADLSSSAPAFPFARPRALLFPIGGCSASPSPAPGLETLSWLVKLVLDDDDGFESNAVLSLSLLSPRRTSGPLSSSAAACRRSRRSPLFRLDSDAAAASSARLLWGLVSICGGDIEGNARRERYGGRIVRSLLVLLRAAAATAPPPPLALDEEAGTDGGGAAPLPAASRPSPPSLLLRSVSLASQAVGAWVPIAAWLGPATATGSGGAGAGGIGESGAVGGGGGGEEDEVEEGLEVDLGLRCGLLRALLFGLEAASKLEEGGKRRLLRAGGEVEAVAAVAAAAVAASAASSSSARSVLSLVAALIGASRDGELRKLFVGHRAELWLAVVASEQELEEEEKEEAEAEGRRRGGDRRVPRPETVSSRLAAACGFASTAALAAEHAPAVLESIFRVRKREREKTEEGEKKAESSKEVSRFFISKPQLLTQYELWFFLQNASRWTPASPTTRLLPALARACDSATLSVTGPRIVEALCEASASERGRRCV